MYVCTYIYIYIYIYLCMCNVYIHIYIYIGFYDGNSTDIVGRSSNMMGIVQYPGKIV